ncbi:GGDEF domain-containing protein [Paenibacillus caseinilyticus]|uniref:GGDEF domain-containing protein n=1 Tax=Paenibacillus caseinilyticus TaxID=3098138 RepID=UPI0022B90C7F|nr:GGDEF domain-containing protein [Paenibacillus caseinilyticus]
MSPFFLRAVVTFIAAYTPLYYGLLLAVPAGWKGTVSDIVSPLGMAAALWILWKGLRSKEKGERRRWTFFFIGSCFYFAAETIWRGSDLLAWQGHNPMLSLGDAFYLAVPIFYFIAIVYSQNHTNKAATLRVLFDLVIIMTVASTLEWHFLLSPHLTYSPDGELGAKVISLLYPVLSAGGWTGSLLFYLRYRERGRREFGELCSIAAVGLWSLANHLYFIRNIAGTYASGDLIDPIWMLALHLMAMASVLPAAAPAGVPPPQGGVRIEHRVQTLMPYLAACVLIGCMLLTEMVRTPLWLGMIATTLLVLARQVLAILDYEKLLGIVSRSNQELERLHRENLYHKEELERTIRQLGELNAMKEAEARTDFLTGLNNRRSINEWMYRHAAAQRKLAVVLLDIDHFKKINDTYGHDTGDIVLTEVSRILRDTAGPSDLAGRFGGEEFIVLQPDTGLEDGAAFAERLRSRIAGHAFEAGAGGPIRVTVSLGITVWNGDRDDIPSMLKRADRSLYMAKRKGRNTVVCM